MNSLPSHLVKILSFQARALERNMGSRYKMVALRGFLNWHKVFKYNVVKCNLENDSRENGATESRKRIFA